MVAELLESELPGAALASRAAAVAARLNRANVALVGLCREVLADDAWAEPGFRSPEHWLTVRVGLSPARAREAVEVARRHDDLPALAERFDEGRLSLDQASVVARFTPATHQRSVVELAEHTTVPQLRRALARYAFDAPGDAVPDEVPDPHHPALRPASVSTWHDVHGRLRLSLDAPADEGALVLQAMRESKDALFAAGRTDATLGDAVVEMASRSLDAVGPSNRSAHYRVYVHLSADSPSGWVNGGGAIPPSLAARFACDGGMQPVVEREGRPVSVGREQRIVPARTRRLVEDRDRGCVFPGCGAGGFVEIHHVTPWSEGGRTDYATNISLCPAHHRGVHTGRFTVSGDATAPPGSADALAFRTSAGLPIRPPDPPDVPPGELTEGASGDTGPPAWVAPTGEAIAYRWLDLPPDHDVGWDDPDRDELDRGDPGGTRRAALRLVDDQDAAVAALPNWLTGSGSSWG